MVDQENEPFELDIQDEPLVVSQQEETLPNEGSIEEPTSTDVADNLSGEVEETQIDELDETTIYVQFPTLTDPQSFSVGKGLVGLEFGLPEDDISLVFKTHFILVAEKYGSINKPVFFLKLFS